MSNFTKLLEKKMGMFQVEEMGEDVLDKTPKALYTQI